MVGGRYINGKSSVVLESVGCSCYVSADKIKVVFMRVFKKITFDILQRTSTYWNLLKENQWRKTNITLKEDFSKEYYTNDMYSSIPY